MAYNEVTQLIIDTFMRMILLDRTMVPNAARPSLGHDDPGRVDLVDVITVAFDTDSDLPAGAGLSVALDSRLGAERRGDLRTALGVLLDEDPDRRSGADLVADLERIEELHSFLNAASARRMVALARPGVAGDASRLVARRLVENPMIAQLTAEQAQVVRDGETVLVAAQLAAAQVGATLRIAPGTASRRVREAVDLIEDLPATVEALEAGGIEFSRAKVLADRSSILSGSQRRDLEQRVLPAASTCSPRQWRNLVDAEIIALDPEAAQRRQRDAVERRRLRLDRLDNGIGRFIADLPAHQAQLVWDLFDAVGEALRGLDDRTADQRRADAFITIVELLASGQTVTIADVLGHPHSTRHDSCHHPEHPCDLRPQDQSDRIDAELEAGAGIDNGNGVGAVGEPGSKPENGTDSDADAHGGFGPFHGKEWEARGDRGTDSEAQLAAESGTALSGPVCRSGSDGGSGLNTEVEPSDPESDQAAGSGDSAPPPSTAPQPPGTSGGGSWTLPTRQGRETHTTVVITVEALAGLAQDPARLAGHGVITADYARALAAAARSVNFLVVDGAGRPVAVGDRAYRPRQRVRDQISTAYNTCIFIGCHQPVARSENDHRIEWCVVDPALGGPTNLTNLHPLCRLHHRLKTFGGWTYRPAEPAVPARRSRPATADRLAVDGTVGRPAVPAAFVFRSPIGLESVSRVDHLVRPRTDTPAPF